MPRPNFGFIACTSANPDEFLDLHPPLISQSSRPCLSQIVCALAKPSNALIWAHQCCPHTSKHNCQQACISTEADLAAFIVTYFIVYHSSNSKSIMRI